MELPGLQISRMKVLMFPKYKSTEIKKIEKNNPIISANSGLKRVDGAKTEPNNTKAHRA